VTVRIAPERDARLQGHYAGVVTRFAAFVIDVFTVALLFALAAQVLDYVVSAVFDTDFAVKDSSILAGVLLALWTFAYFAYPLAVSGRTFGMMVLGLKVVRTDGHEISAQRAIVRVVVMPLSLALFWLTSLLILIKRDRRAIHDLVADTVVVYAWDARSAKLRFLARGQVEPSVD
jgi:uncharacterized RDD family membrane protein YckC